MTEDKNWKYRIKAIQDFCKKMGYKYQVIIERKIQCTRLNNIKDLLAAAKQYSPTNVNRELGGFNSKLTQFLEVSPKTLKDLTTYLSSLLPLEPEEVISLLKENSSQKSNPVLKWD